MEDNRDEWTDTQRGVGKRMAVLGSSEMRA